MCPAAKYLTTFDDGKTYMFPMVNDPDESSPSNYSFKLFINKTWLTNVGKSMPTTTDQLRDVLIALPGIRTLTRTGTRTTKSP